MKYTIYKIRNLINGKIYIGKHRTNNLEDGYMGSGLLIQRAIEKYGIENFEKTILFVFDTEIEMNDKEFEIVDEDFVKDESTYNLAIGGIGAFDSNGENFSKGHVTVRDIEGKVFNVKLDDPRYLSGELIQASIDFKWMHKGNIQSRIFKDHIEEHIKDGWELGRFPNSEYVKLKPTLKKCIHKDDKELRIDNEELQKYLNDGWKLGRLKVSRRCIHKGSEELRVPIEKLNEFLSNGWELGRAKFSRSCWRAK